ncbi:ferritin-like protein [Paracoccus sp. Ld10]|uniref:ferritin-like domain-containing protein n=1 Tax=Paracoccus sp. Ld10 TaxID=649158 RepID=UPI00386D3ED8
MSLHRITDIEGLHRHLHAAMQLEHATIPPYLTALYSIKPGSNTEAFDILRAVAVEEMLHLTLVGNLLNAVGGTPDLAAPGFVATYPAKLPDGEEDFAVDCQKFSPEAIETFLKIERPAELDHGKEGGKTVKRKKAHGALNAAHVAADSDEHFFSIGEFYKAIEDGLDRLYAEKGDALFCGDPARQIGPEYYYSGGGGLIAVTDMATAKAALDLIAEQGEGVTDTIFDQDGEIAHYYRFQQLLLGRYYQEGDVRNHPTGGEVPVDWDSVYPIKTNARLEDFAVGSDLRAAATAFNATYAAFLTRLTRAFQGEPQEFIPAVGDMFHIKELFYQLMRQPITDGGPHGAPTFEIDRLAEAGQ